MSAIEGSAFQERAEQERRRQQQRVEKIQRDNPSLSLADAEEWERRQSTVAKAPKCCPCQSVVRAEIVRVLDVLGPCECGCHQPSP